MKPDWDKLATEYEGSEKVLIADADCTGAGKPLCDKFGVRGYPTLKVFAEGDEEGEDYKGGRDLAALKKFASELGPGCSVDNPEVCSAEQKEKLDKYVAMDAAERATKIGALTAGLKGAETAHEKLLESLQAQYKASQEALEALKDEVRPPAPAPAPRPRPLPLAAPAPAPAPAQALAPAPAPASASRRSRKMSAPMPSPSSSITPYPYTSLDPTPTNPDPNPAPIPTYGPNPIPDPHRAPKPDPHPHPTQTAPELKLLKAASPKADTTGLTLTLTLTP